MARQERRPGISGGDEYQGHDLRVREMGISVYLENRSKFPQEELQQYTGKWIAFSSDGRQIVASATDLAQLEDNLIGAGLDPEHVVFELVPNPDMITGGAELS